MVDSRLLEMAATSEALAGGLGLNDVLASLARAPGRSRRGLRRNFDVRPDDDRMQRFIHIGIDERLAQRLGHPPVGRGLLGELVRREKPLRIDDLAVHESFTGWPEGHPDMAIFLGVPIRAGGRTIGSLYMTRERGHEPFSDADELSGVLLAMQAAVSLSAALAQERTGRLVLLEERVRIAHDLHDG